MKTENPVTIHLKDYQPFPYDVDQVDLDFTLVPEATRVAAKIAFSRRDGVTDDAPLVLDGTDLNLISIAIDGAALEPSTYNYDEEHLTIASVPAKFILETEVEIDPAGNTTLEGLYLSNGIFATQCEAEGFRRISFYPDRPDVMAPFHVRMSGDKAAYPVLLSNGDPIDQGDNGDGTHWAEWRDPHNKPAYLFALVAGELTGPKDTFTTMSGREVALGIYVRPADSAKCDYAMDSLKRCMKWDEEAYGREYDLDMFNIVAVDDFNAGAMENKGLNIFNSALVLAQPETATDDDYERIESVVAHEYFHNWSGNRITCRDWFQICLKEGFTVYRDSGFTEDMREKNVARINSVMGLRARQFAEDAGPLAHPPLPESYIAIDNFYTATVYEKGSENARMLNTLLGDEDFRKATDIFFEKHDGTAATVEDFVLAMEEASGKDLTQFRGWYSQAGTPHIKARGNWDEAAQTYELVLSQKTRPTPGQLEKSPQHMPVEMGLVGESGNPLPLRLEGDNVSETPTNRVVELTEATQTFRFTGVTERPVPSLFRGFSAPVVLDDGLSAADRRHLMANDEDAFNRWEAGQAYGRDLMLSTIKSIQAGDAPKEDADFAAAMGAILADENLDPAFKARALLLPTEQAMAQAMTVIDPDAVHRARHDLSKFLASTLKGQLDETYASLASTEAFEPSAEQAGKRALRNRCMGLLSHLGTDESNALVLEHFANATNMTDEFAGLVVLASLDIPERDAAIASFYDKWKDDVQVTDKWFRVQATSSNKNAVAEVGKLTKHPAFSIKNPNRMRSLVGGFAFGNQLRFNQADGAGYDFVATQLIAVDALNPLVAGRMVTPFESWRRFDAGRQTHAKAAMEKMANAETVSPNLLENVTRMLQAD